MSIHPFSFITPPCTEPVAPRLGRPSALHQSLSNRPRSQCLRLTAEKTDNDLCHLLRSLGAWLGLAALAALSVREVTQRSLSQVDIEALGPAWPSLTASQHLGLGGACKAIRATIL